MKFVRLFSVTKILLVCLILVFSPLSHALQGQGKVEEIKSCGGAQLNGWVSFVFFKLTDGNWFGIYANNTSAGLDSNFNHSLLLTAFSMQLDVEVNANYGALTSCGTTASMLWDNTTDYLRIVRP